MNKPVQKREVIIVKGPLFDQVLKNAYRATHQIIKRKLEENKDQEKKAEGK
ncbi:hypothetical protein GPJ61_11485 [Brevibacillus formosus]|uniref:hypothetical protein n=1 Tax=Brevibacillus formosus TaxID=54913 RepID=UPI001CA52DAC|nr:hypothetical protein [Brevibacillus formosus]MBW5468480.1 hypothetical protein [Brevibacillus formosus]